MKNEKRIMRNEYWDGFFPIFPLFIIRYSLFIIHCFLFYPVPFILSIIPSKKLKNSRRGGLKDCEKDGKIHENIN